MDLKREIRGNILKKRDAMSREEQLTLSHAIMEHAVSCREFLQADEILIYADYKSEVITEGIMEYAFLLGKKVYCPKVCSDGMSGQMDFFQIFSQEDLKEGYRGIREPEGQPKSKWEPSRKKALLIMPGAVFDRQGHRIGYGKGFYDRFLKEHRELCGRKLALAYEIQVEESVPFEAHDQCVEFIVTEKGMIACDCIGKR